MIGIINFTHSDPLYSAIGRKDVVVRKTPSELLRMINDRELDGGMVSLVSLLRNDLELCRGANIHSVSTTMSTLVVSAGAGLRKDMRIAVTSHTRTTEFYTEMVLKGLGINYEMVHTDKTEASDLLEVADYALVIGDEALKVYGTGRRILFDTGYEFSRIYHLNPLYAALAYRKGEKEPLDMSAINEAVYPSREDFEKCTKDASARLSIVGRIIARYYSLIKYDFPDHLNDTIAFVTRHLKSA